SNITNMTEQWNQIVHAGSRQGLVEYAKLTQGVLAVGKTALKFALTQTKITENLNNPLSVSSSQLHFLNAYNSVQSPNCTQRCLSGRANY
ncbi:Hypothetical predicted protein, partial [Paramuricea clavata]